MKIIPLAAIPNQTFSIQLDGSFYNIKINEANGIMAVTLIRNNITILSGARAISGARLIPYRYLEAGNFVFLTENEEYPYYTQFNNTQFLIYASQAELDIIRGT